MDTISRFLRADHHACDAAFGATEAAAAAGRWEIAAARFTGFRDDLERHLGREERILFPRFEARTGQCTGPTQVMRAEHEQMRTLVSLLERMVQARRREAFLNHADTLFTLIQQHNLKEEQVLHPTADQVLEDERITLLASMQQFPEHGSAAVAAGGQ
ncbi:MAG: hypothetical protein B7Z66_11610 [Chromatiales bacterium 21-64-14]|nr:MAG: hypothetical protein B7Z66_11610 [Chromatiales bacterium 21-64-14]